MQTAHGLELLHYRIVLNQDSLRVNSTMEAELCCTQTWHMPRLYSFIRDSRFQ